MQDDAKHGLDGLIVPPLSRRGFVMTSLMSGLTLATTRVEAQVIHTDTDGIEAGEVAIPAADGPMPAYRAVPKGAGSSSSRRSSGSTTTSRTSAGAWPRPGTAPSPPSCMPVRATSRR
jgi:hypothetical protein